MESPRQQGTGCIPKVPSDFLFVFDRVCFGLGKVKRREESVSMPAEMEHDDDAKQS
jgi:hypothetical protein